ncbi:MAG: flagellar basal body rod protein FlgB [Victivallales bacterium]|nr:flagellar basal body rod protein FlgB [Victivallales bacterium]
MSMNVENLVFDDTSRLNAKLIDLSLAAQKVIANNIANAETPNYTRLQLDFRDQLAAAIDSGDISAATGLQPRIEEDTATPVGNDGNNVVLPQEMNDMMQNSVFYRLVTRAFKTRMNILKAAIK